MFVTTFPLARSMRLTVPASWLATHTDPGVTAMSRGHRVVAWRPEVAGGDAGDPQRPIADGDRGDVGGDAERLADCRVGARVDPNHPVGGVQHPQDPVGHGHGPGAGKGDDGGELAAVEGGYGDAGGRGRRLGRSWGAAGVGVGGAPGGGKQHRDDQQLPAWRTLRLRPEVGGGWHVLARLPPRVPGWSILPTPDTPARFPSNGTRLSWVCRSRRGTRSGRRALA